MSRKYKFHDKEGIYFISFATVYWVDLFTRPEYFKVVTDALQYCRTHKSLEIFGYCIMPSHVHLLFRSASGDPSSLLRDLKGFTARALLKEIQNHPQESRKEWLLSMFEEAGQKNSNVSRHQLWQQHNKPIELWSHTVFQEKLNYVHRNPVQSGFVTEDEDWKFSSARNYAREDQTVLEIDLIV